MLGDDDALVLPLDDAVCHLAQLRDGRVDGLESRDLRVEADVEDGVLVVHRREVDHDLHRVAHVIHPEVGEAEREVRRLDRAFRGGLRRLPHVDLVRGARDEAAVDELDLGAVHHGLVATADGVPVHEREVHHVELVLDAPRVVRVPRVFHLAVHPGRIHVRREERQVVRALVGVAVPEVDDAVALPDGKALHVKAAEVGHLCPAVRGDERATAVGVKANAVERAAHASAHDPALAERGTAMRALVDDAAERALVATEDRKVHAKPSQSDDLARLDRPGR